MIIKKSEIKNKFIREKRSRLFIKVFEEVLTAFVFLLIVVLLLTYIAII